METTQLLKSVRSEITRRALSQCGWSSAAGRQASVEATCLGDKVRTTVETTPKGVVVVQRSTDPETVSALQQLASEVSDLVQGGIAAMHSAMMNQAAVPPQAHDQTAAAQSQ